MPPLEASLNEAVRIVAAAIHFLKRVHGGCVLFEATNLHIDFAGRGVKGKPKDNLKGANPYLHT